MNYAAILAGALALCANIASAETVKITIPNYGANFAPVLIAEDKGYFKDEGLDVEVIVSGGGTATAALIRDQQSREDQALR